MLIPIIILQINILKQHIQVWRHWLMVVASLQVFLQRGHAMNRRSKRTFLFIGDSLVLLEPTKGNGISLDRLTTKKQLESWKNIFKHSICIICTKKKSIDEMV